MITAGDTLQASVRTFVHVFGPKERVFWSASSDSVDLQTPIPFLSYGPGPPRLQVRQHAKSLGSFPLQLMGEPVENGGGGEGQ